MLKQISETLMAAYYRGLIGEMLTNEWASFFNTNPSQLSYQHKTPEIYVSAQSGLGFFIVHFDDREHLQKSDPNLVLPFSRICDYLNVRLCFWPFSSFEQV